MLKIWLNNSWKAQCGVGAFLLATLVNVAAMAESLPHPAGEVILEVRGNIENTNVDGEAHFDREMLEALDRSTLVTTTIWTEGRVTFEGVSAERLFDTVGATGSEVVAQALNDYSSIIPIDEFSEYSVLLALTMDGEPMTRRDKGPIWIVYPWDEFPDLINSDKVAHSVWQLRSLTVR